AHFSLLPTFSDTFGFSAIESMSESVPVVATAQGALPEFIHDGENGILLTLPTSDIGAWTHVGRGDRHTAEYEDLFRSESKRLATETCARLKALLERPEAYSDMRLQAHAKAKELFSADDANEFWDDFYCKVMR
ncbi:MAG: glycosyltransferase, partial [Pseudomonadota bacterium]